MAPSKTDLARVLQAAKERFVMSRKSLHGIAHWQRVRENGIRLAKLTGADLQVVELFAFLHDCCRETEFSDPEHGPRAAEFAKALREQEDSPLVLEDEEFATLFEAIRDHTTGGHHKNVTIATCWDADRLDIGRVGKRPLERYLTTRAARDPEMMSWAWKRSRKR